MAPSFARRCEQNFEARIATLNFASPDAIARINDWVSASTQGKIGRVIDRLKPLDMLVLINAIYFRGDWLDPFEKSVTQIDTFHAPAGRRQVQMMNRRASFRYGENGMMQIVALPYAGQRFSLYLLLPHPTSDVGELLRWLTLANLEASIAQMERREGRVCLPRFKMAYEMELSQCLQQLGMRDAFDESRADFSPMSAEPLHVGAVYHVTMLELDETGTEAAAVTAAKMVQRMRPTAPPQPFEFVANRPFVLALRDDWSGTLLFIGLVNAPE